jgi:hypothetical protein
MEQTECSEMLAFKLQTLVNHPEESIQHSEHGENLKSRIMSDRDEGTGMASSKVIQSVCCSCNANFKLV